MSSGLGREKTARAQALRRQGMSNQEIADALGIWVSNVYNSLGPAPGSWRRHADDVVERARSLRWEGKTVREITSETGVPRSTVGDWVKGT